MSDDKIKVACRVRPLISKELTEAAGLCVETNPCGDKNQLRIGKDKLFTYDYVVGPEAGQDTLYDDAVSGLLEGFFKGYNSCILAYGQTGSGKTHTMGSSEWTSVPQADWGIIPRVMHRVFQLKAEMEQDGACEVTIRVSFLELYNEEFKDLLEHNQSNRKSIVIREDSVEDGGGTCVLGMREEIVEDFEGVSQWVEQGCAARTTGKTMMNEASSRSHAIFTVTMDQQREIALSDGSDECASEFMTSKFHFVDLAGSERVKRTGAEGKRFEESVSINRSLFALGNVISALGDEKRRKETTHVPYRDSKLTRLLKDSFGGNSKTLMVACVSPSDTNFEETLNTLQYANRARNIENKAVVNRDAKSAEVLMLRARIESLEKELCLCRGEEFSPLKRSKHEAAVLDEGSEELVQENMVLREQMDGLRSVNTELMGKHQALQVQCDAMEQQLREHGLQRADGEVFRDKLGEYLLEIEDKANVIESLNVELEALRELCQQQAAQDPDDSIVSEVEFDEIHECHFVESSVQNQARIESLSEDISNNEKLTEHLMGKESKFMQLQRQYEAELEAKKSQLSAAVQEANKVKKELLSTNVLKERGEALSKKNQEQEKNIAVLKKTIKEQLKALKVRAAHTERLNRLKEQNERMKKEKIDLMRKERENEKAHAAWRQARSQQIQKLQRDKEKALHAVNVARAKEAKQDVMLDRRKKMIEEKDKKLKLAEKKLASAARNLVRTAQGKPGVKSEQQKLLDQQVDRVLKEKAVQLQLQKLQAQHHELMQRKLKIASSLERAGESGIPSAAGKSRVAEEYQHHLESIEAELQFKEVQINDVGSSLDQDAEQHNLQELASLSKEESAEVVSRFFGNLIESKEELKSKAQQVRELESKLLKQKSEITGLRKRQAKMQTWNETGVDVSMACLSEAQAENLTLQQQVLAVQEELRRTRGSADAQKAKLAHTQQQLEDQLSSITKLEQQRVEHMMQINSLQQDNKRLTVRAKMEGAREEQRPSSLETQLEKAHSETEQAWKEKMAEQARADLAEKKADEFMAKLRRKEKELRFLKGQNMSDELEGSVGQTA